MADNTLLNHIWASKNITERFLPFLNNNFRSDVTFIVGKKRKKVPGHSFILVLCSWQFYNVFELLKLDSYVLIIEDVQSFSFMMFLNYCYTLNDNIDFDLKVILEMLKLAQRFTIPSLIEICEKQILKEINCYNCLIVYRNRGFFSDLQVVQKVLTFCRHYFSSIIQIGTTIKDFEDLPLEAVRDLAKLSPINCDEMELFDILMQWAKRNCEKTGISPSPKYLRMILKDVFYEIRFPAMKSTWMSYIIANYPDMFTKEEITNIFHLMRLVHQSFPSPPIQSLFWVLLNNGSLGHNVNCPRFNCNPRQSVEYVQQFSFWGDMVYSFSGVPDMNNGTTKKMISKFSARVAKRLVGFAFVTKKDEKVEVTSCKIRVSNSAWNDVTVISHVRSKFNWDYDLLYMGILQNVNITPTTDPKIYNFELECEFDTHVPILVSKQSSIVHYHHNDLNLPLNDPNALPYLCFKRK